MADVRNLTTFFLKWEGGLMNAYHTCYLETTGIIASNAYL